ncbi:MAG: hypothetical protein RIQ89_1266, partial [Bacteroidota bacterium]
VATTAAVRIDQGNHSGGKGNIGRVAAVAVG